MGWLVGSWEVSYLNVGKRAISNSDGFNYTLCIPHSVDGSNSCVFVTGVKLRLLLVEVDVKQINDVECREEMASFLPVSFEDSQLKRS